MQLVTTKRFIPFIIFLSCAATASANAPCDCSEMIGICSGSVTNVDNSLVPNVFKTEGEIDRFYHNLTVKSSTKQCSIIEVLGTKRDPIRLYIPNQLVTVVGGQDQTVSFGPYTVKGNTSEYKAISCNICIKTHPRADLTGKPIVSLDNQSSSTYSSDQINIEDIDNLIDFDGENLDWVNVKKSGAELEYDDSVNPYYNEEKRDRFRQALVQSKQNSNVALSNEVQTAAQTFSALSARRTLIGSPSPGSNNAETAAKNKCAEIINSYAPAISAIPIGSSIREKAQNSIKRNNITLEALNKCLQTLPVGTQSYNEVYQHALAVKADSEQSLKIFNQVNVTEQPVIVQPFQNGTTTNTTSPSIPRRSCGPAIDGPGC